MMSPYAVISSNPRRADRMPIRASGLLILFCIPTWTAVGEPPRKLELAEVEHPCDNPATDAKIALGEQLFFDPRLSRTGRVSCATCHDPAKGWSNGKRFGRGVKGRQGSRNVPALLNVAFNRSYFWDGRADSLEQQALAPIQNRAEMDMPLDKLVRKLNGIDGYRRRFQDVFGEEATATSVAKAIAAYERTILSRDVPLDRFLRGQEKALPEAARRGMKLFFGEARCHICHSGPNFTDQKFHNIGIGIGGESPDLGRAEITGSSDDRGAFKTPSLREVAHSAPYMHDGSFETLEEVVEHYNFGGVTVADNPQRDDALQVLYLSEAQVADLVAFLKEGLSSRRLPRLSKPRLPD